MGFYVEKPVHFNTRPRICVAAQDYDTAAPRGMCRTIYVEFDTNKNTCKVTTENTPLEMVSLDVESETISMETMSSGLAPAWAKKALALG